MVGYSNGEFEATIDEAAQCMRMKKISLKPGEFLIFTCDIILDKHQTIALRDRIKALLPVGVPFMLASAIDVFRSSEMMTADGSDLNYGERLRS